MLTQSNKIRGFNSKNNSTFNRISFLFTILYYQSINNSPIPLYIYKIFIKILFRYQKPKKVKHGVAEESNAHKKTVFFVFPAFLPQHPHTQHLSPRCLGVAQKQNKNISGGEKHVTLSLRSDNLWEFLLRGFI